MPRHLNFTSLLFLILIAISGSCTNRQVQESAEEAAKPVEIQAPPYRIVIASKSAQVKLPGLPSGMVSTVELGSERLNALNPAWAELMTLAMEPSVRAIVISEAPQGTATLFSELKERRSDILLLAVMPEDDPLVIQAAADIVLDFDNVARAYSAALIADRMGFKSIISLSSPDLQDDWRSTARQAVLSVASADMGLDFTPLTVTPDKMPEVLNEIGVNADPGAKTDIALVVNDGRLAMRALSLAVSSNVFYIELDRFGNDASANLAESKLSASSGLTDTVLGWVNAARNVAGRPGLTLVWPGELTPILELGALLFAQRIVDGQPATEVNLATVMNSLWEAGQWHASHFVDSQSGVRAQNHFVTGADPYLVGRSYLSSESAHIPAKYRLMAGQ